MSFSVEDIFDENQKEDSSLESPSFAPAGQAGMNTRKGGDFCDELRYAVDIGEGKKASLRIRFEDLVTTRGSTMGKFSARIVYDDDTKSETFTERITLGAPRDGLLRQLKECFPIKDSWSLTLSKIFRDLGERIVAKEMEAVKMVSEIVPSFSTHMLYPFIEKDVANLVFAKGSTGKTTFTVAQAISIVMGRDFLGGKVGDKTKVLVLDYENSEGTLRDKVERIGHGMPEWKDSYMDDIYYKESNGLPLHELADELKKLIEEKGIGLIIIDSAVPAVGGQSEDAACAALYFNALRKMGITSLTIAHETKASTDGKTAFGSIFFMNLSRNVWNLQAEEFPMGATKTITAKHRKCNNGPISPDVVYTMTIVPSSITFSLVEKPKTIGTTKDKVMDALDRFGEMSLAALQKVTFCNIGTLKNTLTKMEEDGEIEVTKTGKRKLKR